MQGRAVRWNYARIFGDPPDPTGLSDAAVQAGLDLMARRLARRGVLVELARRMPPRARYAWLRDELARAQFEYLTPEARLHLDGCGGDCRVCVQAPWCDTR